MTFVGRRSALPLILACLALLGACGDDSSPASPNGDVSAFSDAVESTLSAGSFEATVGTDSSFGVPGTRILYEQPDRLMSFEPDAMDPQIIAIANTVHTRQADGSYSQMAVATQPAASFLQIVRDLRESTVEEQRGQTYEVILRREDGSGFAGSVVLSEGRIGSLRLTNDAGDSVAYEFSNFGSATTITAPAAAE